MDLNLLAQLIYKLRIQRVEHDRQSREIKTIEDKLVKQVMEVVKDEEKTTNYFIKQYVVGRYPAYKAILESLKGEEYVQDIIDHTEPTKGIKVTPLAEISKMERIDQAFSEILEKAKGIS